MSLKVHDDTIGMSAFALRHSRLDSQRTFCLQLGEVIGSEFCGRGGCCVSQTSPLNQSGGERRRGTRQCACSPHHRSCPKFPRSRVALAWSRHCRHCRHCHAGRHPAHPARRRFVQVCWFDSQAHLRSHHLTKYLSKIIDARIFAPYNKHPRTGESTAKQTPFVVINSVQIEHLWK